MSFQLVSKKQAAATFGVSASTLYRWSLFLDDPLSPCSLLAYRSNSLHSLSLYVWMFNASRYGVSYANSLTASHHLVTQSSPNAAL